MLIRLFPFLAWWRQIGQPGVFHGDLIAGLTVAVVAIPQALAYAQLAGLPPYLGLYAAFVPTIIAALWGSCPQLSSGPVALTSLLVAASLLALAPPDMGSYIALAITLALMSGVLQFAAGALRVGSVMHRIPRGVILGFVNAAAVLIAFSQLPALLGAASPKDPNLPNLARVLMEMLHQPRLGTAAFGLASLLFMLVARSVRPRFPAALAVSICTILLSQYLGYQAQGGATVGDLPEGLPSFVLPHWDIGVMIQLLPAALTISVVSFIEVMSSSMTISAQTGRHWEINQELMGQGLAKIASGLSGAFPVSGSFSRSALTFASHARTAWASIIAALMVGVALLFAAGALHHLPNAVLAAIIIMAVLNLFTPGQIITLWRNQRSQGVIAMATFLATLAAAPSIQFGLMTGIVVALIVFFVKRR